MFVAIGDPRTALGEYSKVLRAHPHDARAHAGRADALLALNREDEALREIDAAIKLDSTMPWYFSLRSRALAALERHGEALKAASKAAELAPADPAWRASEAFCLLNLDRPDHALRAADDAIQLDAGYAFGHVMRARALTRLGRTDEARASAVTSVDLSSGMEQAHQTLGRVYEVTGDTEAALSEYRLAAQLAPTKDWYESNLSRFHEEVLGDSERALNAANRAIRLDPDDPAGYWHRSRALRSLKRTDESLTSLLRALDLNPHHADAHFDLADHYRSAAKYEEAVEHFSAAAEASPSWSNPPFQRGLVLVQDLHRPRTAIRAFDACLRIDPAAVNCHFQRAYAFYLLGQHEDALEALDASIAVEETSYARDLRALVLVALERPEQALEDSDRAVALDPHDASILENRAFDVLGALGRWDEALADLQRATELDPSWAVPYRDRGYILAFHFGRIAEALREERKAIQLAPEWGLPRRDRGEILHEQGRDEEALGEFTAAFERDATDWYARGFQAETLRVLGRPRTALTVARSAIEIFRSEWLYRVQASIYRALRDFASAEASWREALELDPMSWDARLGLANILVYEGARPLEAAPHVEWLLAHEPTGEVYLAKAYIDATKGNASEALTALDTAESLGWSRRDLAATRAGVLVRLGMAEEALEELAQFPDAQTDSGLLMERGDALRALGRYQEALAAYSDQIEADDNPWLGYLRRGELLLDQLDRPEHAVRDLERAVQLLPHDSDAADLLRRARQSLAARNGPTTTLDRTTSATGG